MAVNAHVVMAVMVIVNAVVVNGGIAMSEVSAKIALRGHLARKVRNAARAPSAIGQPKDVANVPTKSLNRQVTR